MPDAVRCSFCEEDARAPVPGDHDEPTALTNGKRPVPAATTAVSNVIGRDAVRLVERANQLRAIIAELEDALRRHEQDLVREQLEAGRPTTREADLDAPPSILSGSKVARLSMLVTACAERRDKALREWYLVRSQAVALMIERVGLEADCRLPPSWSIQQSRSPKAASPFCSFCERSVEAVQRLIAGLDAYISDWCVRLASVDLCSGRDHDGSHHRPRSS